MAQVRVQRALDNFASSILCEARCCGYRGRARQPPVLNHQKQVPPLAAHDTARGGMAVTTRALQRDRFTQRLGFRQLDQDTAQYTVLAYCSGICGTDMVANGDECTRRSAKTSWLSFELQAFAVSSACLRISLICGTVKLEFSQSSMRSVSSSFHPLSVIARNLLSPAIGLSATRKRS